MDATTAYSIPLHSREPEASLEPPPTLFHIFWMLGLGQKLRQLWRRRPGVAQQSMRLLTDNLSPAQRDQLEVFDYFDVVGGDTGTRYRIRFGNVMNVEQLDSGGKRMRVLCFA